jgi:hypothetical protein
MDTVHSKCGIGCVIREKTDPVKMEAAATKIDNGSQATTALVPFRLDRKEPDRNAAVQSLAAGGVNYMARASCIVTLSRLCDRVESEPHFSRGQAGAS